jgi:allantoicase
MKPERPAGNDVPPEFLAKRPFAEKPSPEFLQMSLDIADRNLEAMYYRVKDEFFDGMKEIALEGDEERVRQADKAVREIYYDEPKKLAEWEELMSRYEFMEQTLE